MSITLQELAQRINAKVVGDGSALVNGCATIEQATASEITFLANAKYAQFLETTNAKAVVIDAKTSAPPHLTRLIAEDPYFAFRNAVIELHGFRTHPHVMCSDSKSQSKENITKQISALAVIHPTATVGEGTMIHPHVVIEAGAKVGARCVVYPGVYIGENAVIGDESLLYPNVTIYDRCVVGNRVTLHSSTVIGHDGFGYATHKGAHHKIPQMGIAVVEDDVEMGAGCAIERAAMGETRIGKGTKFADLISIGHGAAIGHHCLFVSLVGVSGSVEVGNYVVLGGQVGVAGHLKIGNFVQAAARTAIAQDVPDNMKVGGAPAIEFDKAKRNALAALELYELMKRVRVVERELEKLKQPTVKD